MGRLRIATKEALLAENNELKRKLVEAEETLEAIRNGGIDALVKSTACGERIFTLDGADYIYRIFVETMNEGAATLSSDGTILYANKRLADMLGIKHNKIIGSRMIDYVHPEQKENYIMILDLGLTTTIRTEFSFVRSDGDPLPVLASCNPIDVAPACVSIIFSDLSELKKAAVEISERKVSEETLRKDKETLERLSNEKAQQLLEAHKNLEKAKRLSDIGMLAATIAHEMRNPLAAIKIGIYSIRKKADNPELDVHFERIEKKIADSSQIINNLLFYTKLNQPNLETIAVNDILSECMEAARNRYSRKIGSISKNDTDSIIEADPVQLRELFNNVLNNAVDAIGEKGSIEISVNDTQDDSIMVEIRDDGIGMTGEILDHIFDPFYTTKTKGTGLGLYVCKQIAELHNGSLSISSEPGAGTTVTVLLPRKSRANASGE